MIAKMIFPQKKNSAGNVRRFFVAFLGCYFMLPHKKVGTTLKTF